MLKTAYLNSFAFRHDHFNAVRENFITTICVTNSNVTINLNKKRFVFQWNTHDWFEHWNRSKWKKKTFVFQWILKIDLNIEIDLNKRKKTFVFERNTLGYSSCCKHAKFIMCNIRDMNICKKFHEDYFDDSTIYMNLEENQFSICCDAISGTRQPWLWQTMSSYTWVKFLII